MTEPWELCRGVGASFGHNRAERAEHHLSAFDIVALYTEVLAKGGNLLLNVGPTLDGSIPALQAEPLRAAGRWIRRYAEPLEPSTPWAAWGDADTRIVATGDSLVAIDIGGRGEFPSIDRRHHRVDAVTLLSTGSASNDHADRRAFVHDDHGLHVDALRRGSTVHRRLNGTGGVDDVAVYRLEVSEVPRPVELFAPTPRHPRRRWHRSSITRWRARSCSSVMASTSDPPRCPPASSYAGWEPGGR